MDMRENDDRVGNNARDTCFRKLRNKNASTTSRKGRTVCVWIRVLYDTALVVCLEGAVRRIDECARLNRVDDGAARLGV